MNADTKALAQKVAKGKGLNASDRELMAKITLDPKELTAYTDLFLELGKKKEVASMELIQGEGRFGLYLKVSIPGSYKTLNMGKKKLVRFLDMVDEVGRNELIARFDEGEAWKYEFEITETK